MEQELSDGRPFMVGDTVTRRTICCRPVGFGRDAGRQAVLPKSPAWAREDNRKDAFASWCGSSIASAAAPIPHARDMGCITTDRRTDGRRAHAGTQGSVKRSYRPSPAFAHAHARDLAARKRKDGQGTGSGAARGSSISTPTQRPERLRADRVQAAQQSQRGPLEAIGAKLRDEDMVAPRP